MVDPNMPDTHIDQEVGATGKGGRRSSSGMMPMPQSRAPTPVENAINDVQTNNRFNTSSLLDSLLCTETMQKDDFACKDWEEFDDEDWIALGVFFAAHVNCADKNSATQLENAEQAWL